MLRNAEIAILGLFCLIDSSKWPIIDFFDTYEAPNMIQVGH